MHNKQFDLHKWSFFLHEWKLAQLLKYSNIGVEYGIIAYH